MISPRPVCLLLSLLAASLVLASTATAGSCGEQIIDDWADDASPGVDGTYPIPCYREAIAGLPEDLRSYSSAADDIQRALQARLRADDDGSTGGTGGGSSGDSGGGSSSDGGAAPAAGGGAETPAETEARDPAASTDTAEPAQTSPAATVEAPVTPDGEAAAAAPPTELLDQELGDGSGSLPVPVIVVLALAGVSALIAAGWLVRRQVQGRQRPSG